MKDENPASSVRSPYLVTWHVWSALFMREFVSRMTTDRFAPVWLFLQPILHIVILVAVRDFIGRGRLIPGAEFIPWLVIGITTYIMFRTLWIQGMNAIQSNKALFAYRQVHPADTVLVRCAMEAKLQAFVLMIMVFMFTGLGHEMIPDAPLEAVEVLLAMTLLGLGMGLMTSVMVTFFPESAKIVNLISLPLYFLSGVILPIQFMPHGIQEFLLYNPLLHAVELIRAEFFSTYHPVRGVSLWYVYQWAICTILFGLALHVKFKIRMVAR